MRVQVEYNHLDKGGKTGKSVSRERFSFAPTGTATWSSVRCDNLPELDNMRKNSPAAPKRLGAIPTSNVLAAVSSTNRIALTGMISSKQINPIHPNSRLALPLMLLSVFT